MATYKTTGIILRRHNYGEADRIYTIMTPDGKVSAIAKGVRRIRAKLASHLEVFTEIELMLAKGKNLDVITSARTHTQYALSRDYDRLRTGFLFLEMADKLSDKQQTGEVYACLREGIDALAECHPHVVELAFKLKLLTVLGQTPQTETAFDTERPLQIGTSYYFDFSRGGFSESQGHESTLLSPEAVKLWRICLRHAIHDSAKIKGVQDAASESLAVCDQFYAYMYDIRFKAKDI